jgi:hypothetical protein
MRSLAYFPRQLRDLLVTRGAAMLIIATMVSLPVLLSDYGPAQMDWQLLLSRTLNGMVAFLIMVATYGVIGEDMRRGHFRLLFSKPISPVTYYGQAIVAAWIGFSLTLLVVIGVFALVREPVWPTDALVEAHMGFLLLGGIIVGLSRFTRLDWVVGLLLMIFGDVLRDAWPAADSLWGKLVNVAMPPSHLEVADYFPATGGFEIGPALWIVCYAGLFIVAGLAAVRFVPMGSAR